MKIGNKMLSLLILFSLISCQKPAQELKPKPGGEDKSQTISLTPFIQLNQGKSEINSHKEEWSKSVLKKDFRSYKRLGPENKVNNPTYARIRSINGGKYILTWQDAVGVNGNGENTFYALSSDLINWENKGYLWQSQTVTNGKGETDTRRFTNANTLQLSDGRIIAVCAFCNANTYSSEKYKSDHGIMIKYSSDGAKTWTDEQVIYYGPCWEPHLIELKSGEIQCYISESRPWTSSSHSGTSLIRSTDGGRTWTPSLGSENMRVMRKQWWNEKLKIWCFTYQMPVGVQLNNSKQFAFAMESCNRRAWNDTNTWDEFSIAMAYSNEDGTYPQLKGDEVTPKTHRIDSLVVRGVAPYLIQFPSGETMLAYDKNSLYYYQLGNATAREFHNEQQCMPGKGSWGGLDLETAHSALVSIRNSSNESVTIDIQRYNLNHSISATNRSPKIDGINNEWEKSDEAVFIGSTSQAQATLRCSADKDYLYFLIEVWDETLSSNDFGYLLLSPNTGSINSSARRIRFNYNGLKSTDQYAGGWKELKMDVPLKTSYEGTPTNKSDIDKGFIAEIRVAKQDLKIENGSIMFNLGYFDSSANVEDSLTDVQQVSKWLEIKAL